MVTEYIRMQSYQCVRLDFAVRFLDREPLSKSVIHYKYKEFQENVTISNRSKNNSDRRITNSTNSTDRCCCRRHASK